MRHLKRFATGVVAMVLVVLAGAFVAEYEDYSMRVIGAVVFAFTSYVLGDLIVGVWEERR